MLRLRMTEFRLLLLVGTVCLTGCRLSRTSPPADLYDRLPVPHSNAVDAQVGRAETDKTSPKASEKLRRGIGRVWDRVHLPGKPSRESVAQIAGPETASIEKPGQITPRQLAKSNRAPATAPMTETTVRRERIDALPEAVVRATPEQMPTQGVPFVKLDGEDKPTSIATPHREAETPVAVEERVQTADYNEAAPDLSDAVDLGEMVTVPQRKPKEHPRALASSPGALAETPTTPADKDELWSQLSAEWGSASTRDKSPMESSPPEVVLAAVTAREPDRIPTQHRSTQRPMEQLIDAVPVTNDPTSVYASDNSGEATVPVTSVVTMLDPPPAPAVVEVDPAASDIELGEELARLPEDSDEFAGLGDEQSVENQFPIDLPTVLRLTGSENWTIRLAVEQIHEARARYDAAKVLWLPSLNGGLGYTKHDGQIQATQGPVIDVSRNSLFTGGGLGTGNAPLTGGAGGPARFFVDLSVADAIFEPLATKQLYHAEQYARSATFNDTMMQATVAYYELVRAQGQFEITKQNLADAESLQQLTEAFLEAGRGSRADTARAKVESFSRMQDVIQAEFQVKAASAELARVLQLDPQKLDPNTLLVPLEGRPVPVELVDESNPMSQLISLGLRHRPEICENLFRVESDRKRFLQEKWRPLIPNVFVGASAGGFGGGIGDRLTNFDGRSDVDLLAVWQLRNLGFGNHAARDERASIYRQALLEHYRVRDVISTEVATAYFAVQASIDQLKIAEANIVEATESYDRNSERIRLLQGLPLEVLQSLQALASARQTYLDTVIDYNQAQARLLRAIGRPVTVR